MSLLIRGLDNISTAPSYLVINVADQSDSNFIPYCFESTHLYHKFADELNMPNNDRIFSLGNRWRIIGYVKKHKDLNFKFRVPITGIPIFKGRGDTLLQIARTELGSLCRDSLGSLIISGNIYSYFKNKYGISPLVADWDCLQRAIATVYFEKGIVLGRGCLDPSFYIYDADSRKEPVNCK
ncbi:MAG TPA: hypothetical protein VLX68_08790 [Chitinivibrionales bacterium]|nr:hypothetical protein [Chitinivibrionales bacterium]